MASVNVKLTIEELRRAIDESSISLDALAEEISKATMSMALPSHVFDGYGAYGLSFFHAMYVLRDEPED